MWSFAVEDNLDPKINKKKYNIYSLIYHFWHKRYLLLFILTNHIPFKYLVQKFLSLLIAVHALSFKYEKKRETWKFRIFTVIKSLC